MIKKSLKAFSVVELAIAITLIAIITFGLIKGNSLFSVVNQVGSQWVDKVKITAKELCDEAKVTSSSNVGYSPVIISVNNKEYCVLTFGYDSSNQIAGQTQYDVKLHADVEADILVVAGGGAGGRDIGAGGSAGSIEFVPQFSLKSKESYVVKVGKGGNKNGGSGSDSSFSDILAIKGLGGASGPTSSSKGRGGSGAGGAGGSYGGWVGGGYGGPGINKIDVGGDEYIFEDIFALESGVGGGGYFAGGGGGGANGYTNYSSRTGLMRGGAGGIGGGGKGANIGTDYPEEGLSNTGGGGGGGGGQVGHFQGANGGSGIVIVRVATP